MFELFESVYMTIGGSVAIASIAIVLLLGVIGPAWEGTKSNRSIFWTVFLPCLVFLLVIVFEIGRVLDNS